MARPASAALHRPEVETLLAAARRGKPSPAYLLSGESLDTAAVAQAVVDAVVPPANRSFNLEVYDGRATPVGTVLDSLRTPPFLPGLKVVWLRESPLFLSGEKRPEVTRAMFAAWNEGQQKAATEKMLTLAALAGWTQEQFVETLWSAASKTRLREVFGEELDAAEVAVADAIRAACLARDLSVHAFRDEGSVLLDFLDAGIPPGSVLLLTASAVDARKRLVKRLRELGAVVDLAVARERSGALSKESVSEMVGAIAAEFGKRVDAEARDLILRRAGTDAAQVENELEKLCLFVGERPAITAKDVVASFRDMAESWIFDFTSAFAARQAERAVSLLRGLFEQGEPALRLLAMIAREVRLLLVARECLDEGLAGSWRADLPFNAFQSRLLPKIDAETQAAFGKAHPFVLYKRFQDAGRVRAGALREALVALSDLDVRLKSAPGDPALLLEAFVLGWCGAGAAERRAR